jgi:hypothetical protein
MTRMIYLSRSYSVFVSEEDFERVSAYSWFVNLDVRKRPYACRYAGNKRIYMHREITACPVGMVVDHINGNTLDNRRSNLRVCTQKLNMQNCVPWSRSGYRGVSLIKNTKRYRVRITDLDGDELNLGSYTDVKYAAMVYDAAALMLYGDYAWLNFPIIRKETEHEETDIPF